MTSFSKRLKIKSAVAYKKMLLRMAAIGRPIERKVLFESFNGRSYSDNPRAVSEALHLIDPTIQIVWVINDVELLSVIPAYVKTVKRHSYQYAQEIATCSCYVVNEALEPFMVKRKGQFYIQTWHGDRAFKKILYDSWENRNRPKPVMDEKLTDLCVAGSSYGVRQFRSAFNYNGEILIEGTPRDDCLCQIDISKVKDIKKRLNIDNRFRCLLYAPTFRNENRLTNGMQRIQGIDLIAAVDKCEASYGGEWVCLVRSHPNNKGINGYDQNQKIIDVSKYPDMADLLLITDCMITDYSSSAGDFALTHRPLFLFQDDIDKYCANERQFYFNIDESPYIIAHSQEELEDIITGTSHQVAKINCDKILDFYNTKESGKASNAVAKRIVKHVDSIKV